MPIAARCVCGKEYKFKDEYAGRRAKCPACGHVVRIPGARPAGSPLPHSPLREDRRSRTRELVLRGSAGFVVLVGIGLVVYFLFFSGPSPRAPKPAATSPAAQPPSAAASEEPAPASGPPAPAVAPAAGSASAPAPSPTAGPVSPPPPAPPEPAPSPAAQQPSAAASQGTVPASGPPETGEWRAKVLGASVVREYSEGQMLDKFTVHPGKAGMRLWLVKVEFEAASGAPGVLKKFLTELPEDIKGPSKALEMFDGIEKWENVLAQVFLSARVRLKLADGNEVPPSFTDMPPDCLPWTAVGGRLLTGGGIHGDPGALACVRTEGLTTLIIQPKKKVVLTLIYEVPEKTTAASLLFCDCPPLEVRVGGT